MPPIFRPDPELGYNRDCFRERAMRVWAVAVQETQALIAEGWR